MDGWMDGGHRESYRDRKEREQFNATREQRAEEAVNTTEQRRAVAMSVSQCVSDSAAHSLEEELGLQAGEVPPELAVTAVTQQSIEQ
jgi:hypothetical protein